MLMNLDAAKLKSVVSGALLSLCFCTLAHAEPMLDALAGDWSIRDASGAIIGRSTIAVQTPDAMLFEERRIGNEPAQQLWFERSERAGGWAQLFLGPNGIREFALLSAQARGRWCSAPILCFGTDLRRKFV